MKRNWLFGISIGLVFLFGAVFGGVVSVNSPLLNTRAKSNYSYGSKDLSQSDLQLLTGIYNILDQNYLKKTLPTDKAFTEAAAKGMLNALKDKYTNYYTKEEWDDLQNSNAGLFEGVGIKLLQGETYPIVESPITGSPAAQAGIMPLDVIVKVDGVDMRGKSIVETAQKIRGPKGSKVKLTLYRDKDQKQLDFEVERKEIDIKSIEVEKVGEGYRLQISKFTESDMSEFESQLNSAVVEINNGHGKFVILDLRNNTGGWVSAAKLVLEEFLHKDTLILKEVDRDGNVDEVRTEREGRLTSIPMMILVNEGSASASEIVAGALQDYDRAKLIGKSTVGKGVEQTIVETPDGGRIFVVFREWKTPKDRSLSADHALQPDAEVDLSTKDLEQGKDPQLQKALEMLK
jgi:carboxyl-terminal processing protease